MDGLRCHFSRKDCCCTCIHAVQDCALHLWASCSKVLAKLLRGLHHHEHLLVRAMDLRAQCCWQT